MKMKRMFCYIFLLALFRFNFAYAEDKKPPQNITSPPKFLNLGKANGNDIIKMDCESDDPNFNSINCEFTQILILKKTDAELTEAREKRKSEFAKVTAKEIEETKKQTSQKMTEEQHTLLNSLTPEKKKYSNKARAMIEDVNKSKSRAEVIHIMDNYEEFENKCCTVHINTWKNEFRRISQFKWLSNPGPRGFCNVVKVATLEAQEDSYALWKFTEVTVSVDVDKKRDNMIDKWCGGIELNKPVTYSWNIPTSFIADCQCIKYSW
jgi:phosphatidate phosphatase PAH1